MKWPLVVSITRLRGPYLSPFRAGKGECLACLGRAALGSSSGWTCRNQGFHSESGFNKPYYVTTPIFYVNASPHVGHLYTMILADSLARWQRLSGRHALLCTGTDEHGSKVQRAADIEGVSPETLCEQNSNKFLALAYRAGIWRDFFMRTTQPEHKKAVQVFWNRIRDSGHIYMDIHQGWYSISDEAFYNEDEVQKWMEPTTGRILMTAKASGSTVEWVKEETYRFRLISFRERLLKFYRENPGWIVPTWRQAEVVEWVRSHLTDLSISRPRDRVSWGIPVPEDDQHTIYIWVDALVSYLTATGFPDWETGPAFGGGGWPADIHVIGKEIVRFHCIYWPALLMAADVPLPNKILVHGHWRMGGRKMSKSLGNVVDPFEALDRWEPEALRHFMISQGCINSDADYSNRTITVKYQKELQNGLGNMLTRVVGTNRWSLREAVLAITVGEHAISEAKAEPKTARVNQPGDPESVDLKKVEEAISNQRTFVHRLPSLVHAKMDELDPVAALREIQNVVAEGNVFITNTEPWNLAALEDQRPLHEAIFAAGETLRVAGILLQPFMPNKMKTLLERLGVHADHRMAKHAVLGMDSQYGSPIDGEGKPTPRPRANTGWERLFPRLALEDVDPEEAIRRVQERKKFDLAKKYKKMRDRLKIR